MSGTQLQLIMPTCTCIRMMLAMIIFIVVKCRFGLSISDGAKKLLNKVGSDVVAALGRVHEPIPVILENDCREIPSQAHTGRDVWERRRIDGDELEPSRDLSGDVSDVRGELFAAGGVEVEEVEDVGSALTKPIRTELRLWGNRGDGTTVPRCKPSCSCASFRGLVWWRTCRRTRSARRRWCRTRSSSSWCRRGC